MQKKNRFVLCFFFCFVLVACIDILTWQLVHGVLYPTQLFAVRDVLFLMFTSLADLPLLFFLQKYYGLDAKWGDIEQWMVGFNKQSLCVMFNKPCELRSVRSSQCQIAVWRIYVYELHAQKV